MQQPEFEAFISSLADIEQETLSGYTFFFVGDDHRLPFVTIAQADNEYDSISNLNREGVFRINIGISKTSYAHLVDSLNPAQVDYTLLNIFLPHPQYAKQYFVCILNPEGDNIAITQNLILEAYAISKARAQRRINP